MQLDDIVYARNYSQYDNNKHFKGSCELLSFGLFETVLVMVYAKLKENMIKPDECPILYVMLQLVKLSCLKIPLSANMIMLVYFQKVEVQIDYRVIDNCGPELKAYFS